MSECEKKDLVETNDFINFFLHSVGAVFVVFSDGKKFYQLYRNRDNSTILLSESEMAELMSKSKTAAEKEIDEFFEAKKEK